MKFVSRLLEGEKMTDLCQEFGISRVTGHKILQRYKQDGVDALNDRSKRPWRLANQTPASIENAILEMKERYPTWGAPKILVKLQQAKPNTKLPARSTVHAILDRHGLVKKKSRRSRQKSHGTNLMNVTEPNQLWCADFKGQFQMGNGKYCYPLTITDQCTRYLLNCEAFENTREKESIEAFKRVFNEYGLPSAIRTDNGVPFAARSLFNLSKLSVFWLRLGIGLERIEPGHPEQNGRHERMHRTLKQEVTKPAGANLLQQQELLDSFTEVFNNERPHEALGMKCPKDVYKSSSRKYSRVLEEYDYSAHDFTRRISLCGGIKLKGGRKIFISDVFGGQDVGIKEVEDGVWLVSFMDYELGYYGTENNLFNPGPNPFLE
jgi:putative transposase